MIFDLAKLQRRAKTRPRGYAAEVLAAATRLPDGRYELSEAACEILSAKYRRSNTGEKTVGWRKKNCTTCKPIICEVRSVQNQS